MRSLAIAIIISFASTGLAADDGPTYTFGTTVVSTTGLEGHIYYLKEKTGKLPRLEKMKPVGAIYTNQLNVWPQEFDEGFPGIGERFEWFGIEYSGRFWVETAGRFRFSLLSDDGSKLKIDGKEVIDNDGAHQPLAFSASAVLSRGVHSIGVSYFQGPRYSVALVLAVAPPGAGWRIFNTDDFLPPKDPSEWVSGTISEVGPSTNPDRRRPRDK